MSNLYQLELSYRGDPGTGAFPYFTWKEQSAGDGLESQTNSVTKKKLSFIDRVGVCTANRLVWLGNCFRCYKISCLLSNRAIDRYTYHKLRFIGFSAIVLGFGALAGCSWYVVTKIQEAIRSGDPIFKCEKNLEKFIWPNDHFKPEVYKEAGLSEEGKLRKLNEKVNAWYAQDWNQFFFDNGRFSDDERCKKLSGLLQKTGQDYCSKMSPVYLTDCAQKLSGLNNIDDLNQLNTNVQNLINSCKLC